MNAFSICAKPCPCSAAPSDVHTDKLSGEPGCQVGDLNSSAVIFNKNINCSAPLQKNQKLPACWEQGLFIERFTFNFEQIHSIILSRKKKKKKSPEIFELFSQLPGRLSH